MIRAESLSRRYGDRDAVRDLSFEVRSGEVMGLLGPNGAGKSTTMKMLTCYLPPSSGSATVAGIPLEQDIEVRRRIGYLPEHAPSYHDLNARTHLTFIGRMQGLSPATLADRIGEMARACGIESVLNRRIDELSKGFRQRVGLAASMLHDPECLILDEPTTGLDPNQIVEIRQLIRRLGEKKTVLLSSHVLSEVEAVCDRMMIIDGGRLQVIGTREELTTRAHSGTVLHARLKGEAEATMAALQQQFPDLLIEAEVEEDASRLLLTHPDAGVALAEALFHAAVQNGGVIVELRPQQTSLEDVFHKLTGGAA
jgi:ABC-2 type transport system ATP-binding protein